MAERPGSYCWGRSVEWWPAMRGALAEFRAATGVLLLRQLAGTLQARNEVFDAARGRFAELLGVDQQAASATQCPIHRDLEIYVP